MESLNYHHLMYFWTIAREGGVTRAAAKLGLSQPTLSAQLKLLEEHLGARLFVKAGRGLVVTDLGKVVFRYAEDIFSLGQELQEVVAGRAVARSGAFVVGISEAFSGMLARRLLQPILQGADAPRLVCRRAGVEALLDGVVRREVDLVLSDQPVPMVSRLKIYSHLLG